MTLMDAPWNVVAAVGAALVAIRRLTSYPGDPRIDVLGWHSAFCDTLRSGSLARVYTEVTDDATREGLRRLGESLGD
jgi:hypothetical protein